MNVYTPSTRNDKHNKRLQRTRDTFAAFRPLRHSVVPYDMKRSVKLALLSLLLFTQGCNTGNVDHEYPAYYQLVDVVLTANPLIEIVRDTEDSDAKWRAIRALGSLRYEGAVPLMIECLKDKNPYVRANAARALGDMRIKAASVRLLDLLKSETDGGVIEQTSLALTLLDAHEAVPLLKIHANHDCVQTRVWVVQAIGELGTKADIPFLAERLNSSDMDDQEISARALGALLKTDFGFPKTSGPYNPKPCIENARAWWNMNKTLFNSQ